MKNRKNVKIGVYLHGPIKKVVHYHMHHFFKINCGFIVISFQNLGKQQTWAPRQCTSFHCDILKINKYQHKITGFMKD